MPSTQPGPNVKLYYFKDPAGNFGDDLNPWLWRQLLPDFFDNDETEVFVGIGTLLNHRLPGTPRKHIFGSGYGYGEPPKIDDRFVIHAVRGYETARVLDIPRERVITDAAVLLRSVPLPPPSGITHKIGFIPHCQSSRYYEWEKVCEAVGLKYISAEWDVDRVLREMQSCEKLVCEAMHGAIAADTLRIPWIAVSCYDYISAFKWRDWLSTLNLPYEPITITSLYDIERNAPLGSRLKNSLKRGLHTAGLWSDRWTPAPRKRTGSRQFERAVEELRMASLSPALLSEDRLLDNHVERYLGLLEQLRMQRCTA